MPRREACVGDKAGTIFKRGMLRNCEYCTDTEEPLKAGKVREEEHEAHPRVVPEGPEETEDPCV